MALIFSVLIIGALADPDFRSNSIVFGITFLTVSLSTLMYALVRCFNSTMMTVTTQGMTKIVRPFALRKTREFPREEIAQVFVPHVRWRRRHCDVEHLPVLQLMTKAGNNHSLITGRNAREFSDFEFLRQLILEVLDIELVDYVS